MVDCCFVAVSTVNLKHVIFGRHVHLSPADMSAVTGGKVSSSLYTRLDTVSHYITVEVFFVLCYKIESFLKSFFVSPICIFLFDMRLLSFRDTGTDQFFLKQLIIC